ncbi:PaaI family thioesterase [Streptomyces sp. NPDC096132]|uniref:PaaI family thioesterase n=1 Tax=Streptomyces sp. NPDC096132 TaxID=3366075 RepID=UPI0037FB49BD
MTPVRYTLETAQQALTAQPFSRLTGARLTARTESEAGTATAGLDINFLRPARGSLLIARATVIHATGRQAFCRCEVYTSNPANQREHVATVTATVVRSAHSTLPVQG